MPFVDPDPCLGLHEASIWRQNQSPMAPHGSDWGVGQGKEAQIPSNDPLGVPGRHHLERLDLALEYLVRPPMRYMLAYWILPGHPVLLGFADILRDCPLYPTVS